MKFSPLYLNSIFDTQEICNTWVKDELAIHFSNSRTESSIKDKLNIFLQKKLSNYYIKREWSSTKLPNTKMDLAILSIDSKQEIIPKAVFEIKAYYTYHIADNSITKDSKGNIKRNGYELTFYGDKRPFNGVEKNILLNTDNHKKINLKEMMELENSTNKKWICEIDRINNKKYFYRNGMFQDTIKLHRLKEEFKSEDLKCYQILVGIHPLMTINEKYENAHKEISKINLSLKKDGDFSNNAQTIKENCFFNVEKYCREQKLNYFHRKFHIGTALDIEWEMFFWVFYKF